MTKKGKRERGAEAIGFGRKYNEKMYECDEQISGLMLEWMKTLTPSSLAALLLRHAAILAMTEGVTSSALFGKVAANSFLTEVKREEEAVTDDGKPRN